jgi:hypothetical protein
MNITINDNDTIPILNGSTWITQTVSYIPIESTTAQNQQQKPFDYLHIIEICSLCLIFIEQTIIFFFTFRKRSPKESLFDAK